MRRMMTASGLAAVLLSTIFITTARASEEDIALDKVAKPLLDAVKARFPDAKLTGAAKEVEDGKTTYEVTIQEKEHKIDVTLTPEAAIVLIEKEIAGGDLPQPVTKTLNDKYPAATHKVIESVTKVDAGQEKLAYFEVLLVTSQKQTIEVQVDPSGKIVNEDKK